MKRISYILLLAVLAASAINACAQSDANLVKAYNSIRTGKIDSAKIYIDNAIKDSATRKDPQFWYVRGFIYKELYKKYETADKQTLFRDTAVADLFTSTRIDTSATNKQNNYNVLTFLAGSYYNDAGALVDSLHYDLANEYYRKYVKITDITAPSSLPPFEISYNLKLGTVYSFLFFHSVNDKVKTAYLDSARDAYNTVLSLNSNDVSANYNLAILYYNQAVYIINETNFDADISRLNAAQDTSVRLALRSLPYMQRTYQLDPGKKDAVKGLEGIYYLLHDTQKFAEYQQKLKALEGGK